MSYCTLSFCPWRWGGTGEGYPPGIGLGFPAFKMAFPISEERDIAWWIKPFCPPLCRFYWQLVLAIDDFLFWKEKTFKNKFCPVLHWNSAKPWLESLCEGQGQSCKWTYNNGGGQGFPAFVRRAGRRRCLTCISCYPISYCSGRAQKSVDCSWRQPVHRAHCWQRVVQSTGYNDVQDLWM